MNSNSLITKAIQVRLLRLGKTQKEMAVESGLAPSALTRYTTGKTAWKISTLDSIAHALGWQNAFDVIRAARNEKTASSQTVAA